MTPLESALLATGWLFFVFVVFLWHRRVLQAVHELHAAHIPVRRAR
jgi:hypothetical protein